MNAHFAPPFSEIPTTMLYGLEPRGACTGDVESADSYAMSLAFEHRVAVVQLLRLVMGPQLQQFELFPEGGVAKLVEATGRPELAFSSLRVLQPLVANFKGVKKKRVCLACVRDDLKGPYKQAYGRLLWSVPEVTCCPVHRRKLIEISCRTKRKGMFFYHQVAPFGVCRSCGSVGYFCCRAFQARASAREVEVAEMIRGVIANLREISRSELGDMKQAVSEYAASHGGMVRLAICAGMSKSSLSHWLSRDSARMCLRGYIQLARAMSVSLSGLLQGRLESATFFSRVPQKPRRAHRVDVEKVTSELAKAIEKGNSLHSVARQTGHCQRTLKHVAPALCALVLEQSRTQRHARRDQQLAVVSDKTLEIARELTRQGRPFTNRNIALLTSGPWKAFDSLFRLLFRHLLAGHSLEDLAMPIDPRVKLAVEQAVSRHKEAVGSLVEPDR